VTLITNLTTAIGFIVLIYTDIRVLKEFGIVAAINIIATFIVSLLLIPAFFAYLPAPSARQLRHLDFKIVTRILHLIDLAVHRYPRAILMISAGLLLVSLVGITQIKAVAFMVDDLPEESGIRKDLAFFERNFGGVMPLEIVVDLGKKNAVTKVSNLRKVDELETWLREQPELSAPVSLVGFAKAATFSYFNETEGNYRLPTNQERNFIFAYLSGQKENSGLIRSFVDSTGQFLRISLKMADIGSIRMDSLINHRIIPATKDILEEADMSAQVTGTTFIFIKGNKFLVQNLQSSLLLAIVLIAVIMALLFGSFRMVLISVIPNLIPLAITAGIMGYFGIPLKPSTALVFSIAFGIAVDDAIHFLAKYRQELFNHKFYKAKAISVSIQETGTAMMYTSIILFCGFVIFVFSDFGGTVALGLLTSITLICAMVTNLILLPALLLLFDNPRKNRKITFAPLIEHYQEFYHEDEDEEIDLNLIRISDQRSEDE
jgi:predicted RND superfamily exporter protein